MNGTIYSRNEASAGRERKSIDNSQLVSYESEVNN